MFFKTQCQNVLMQPFFLHAQESHAFPPRQATRGCARCLLQQQPPIVQTTEISEQSVHTSRSINQHDFIVYLLVGF